jgi:carbon starvation protein CstA
MIYYISNYLLIGALFGLLATLMNQHLSLKDESVKQFNAGESILLIILWPFYLSLFFYYIFKK